MKVTRLGGTRPLVSIGSIIGGGTAPGATESPAPSGQVPTSNGSNGVSWGSNVGIIQGNGVNALGPIVNFADGSNTTVSVSSNTIRIHATGGGSSPLTTKGDLYTYSTANDRLAVGSNGTAVIADSLEATGIRYTRAAMVGEVLVLDTPAGSPLVFADLLQNEAQDDLIYEDM